MPRALHVYAGSRHRLPQGHLIITLRTIVESSGNEYALTAPAIWRVSDLVLAHPSWSEHGLAWIEAFDNIDLLDLAKKAKANKKAVPARVAMATMLYERLAPIFDLQARAVQAQQDNATLCASAIGDRELETIVSLMMSIAIQRPMS